MPNPQLAVDWVRDRVQFPCIAQPKIDGCRGGQYNPGQFTARTLKAYKNKALTKFYSQSCFDGIDGELVVPGKPWTYSAMCRDTTSITNTIASPTVPEIVLFDYVPVQHLSKSYEHRYDLLESVVTRLRREITDKVHRMPSVVVDEMDELLELDDKWVGEGYEGTIVRSMTAPHKPGRSTQAMELWRIKRWIDFEIRVTKLIEAMENRNEAKTNALGHTERSTHKANKHGKGMVGMIQGEVLQDVVYEGKLLFPKGMVIDCGPGKLTHPEREFYWRNPTEIARKIGKVKTLPHGVKEKPRMPTWLVFRDKVDIV